MSQLLTKDLPNCPEKRGREHSLNGHDCSEMPSLIDLFFICFNQRVFMAHSSFVRVNTLYEPAFRPVKVLAGSLPASVNDMTGHTAPGSPAAWLCRRVAGVTRCDQVRPHTCFNLLHARQWRARWNYTLRNTGHSTHGVPSPLCQGLFQAVGILQDQNSVPQISTQSNKGRDTQIV